MKWGWVLIEVLTFVLGMAVDAYGCSRCGRTTCRSCYVSSYVAPSYVAPVVVQQATPNVYVIQSNYPQPLVAQGSSQYVSTTPSLQSAQLPFVNPDLYFQSRLQLLKAAHDGAAIESQTTSALFQRVVELQAPAVERLASGQAAQMVLRAAGLDPAHNVSGTSSAVVINRDASGQLQVLQLNQEQVQRITAQASSTTTTTTQTTVTPANPSQQQTGPTEGPTTPYPLLSQFCGKCHGLNVAQPRGQFYIGDDPNVAQAMETKFFKTTDWIDSGKMPPSGEPQPTREQQAGILNEIRSIIKERSVQ